MEIKKKKAKSLFIIIPIVIILSVFIIWLLKDFYGYLYLSSIPQRKDADKVYSLMEDYTNKEIGRNEVFPSNLLKRFDNVYYTSNIGESGLDIIKEDCVYEGGNTFCSELIVLYKSRAKFEVTVHYQSIQCTKRYDGAIQKNWDCKSNL